MNKQPNTKTCFACGLENETGLKLTFYSKGSDMVVCNYQIPLRFEGFPGVAHGGVVASILDEAIVRAFMAADPDRFMYTARLMTRYRNPVPIEQPLRIVGTILRDRGRMAESKAELFGPDGTLLAEAEALVVEYPKDDNFAETLANLGWEVYPDEETKA